MLPNSVLLLTTQVLDELDVPFRLKAGVLGKLRIKIPWNSLYKQPFELYISGVSIILKPRGISGVRIILNLHCVMLLFVGLTFDFAIMIVNHQLSLTIAKLPVV